MMHPTLRRFSSPQIRSASAIGASLEAVKHPLVAEIGANRGRRDTAEQVRIGPPDTVPFLARRLLAAHRSELDPGAARLLRRSRFCGSGRSGVRPWRAVCRRAAAAGPVAPDSAAPAAGRHRRRLGCGRMERRQKAPWAVASASRAAAAGAPPPRASGYRSACRDPGPPCRPGFSGFTFVGRSSARISGTSAAPVHDAAVP